MQFVQSGNDYSAILPSGDVIKFEDEREAQAVQAIYEDVQSVLGKRLPEWDSRVTMKVCCENSKLSNTQKKKKVRINIDTDTEFFASSVSQSEPPSPTRYAGEGMKKALA